MKDSYLAEYSVLFSGSTKQEFNLKATMNGSCDSHLCQGVKKIIAAFLWIFCSFSH